MVYNSFETITVARDTHLQVTYDIEDYYRHSTIVSLYRIRARKRVKYASSLSNCYSYCTESAQNEYKYPMHDIVQLVIVQYRARAHLFPLVVFFQVTEKG